MATAQVFPAKLYKSAGWTALARIQLPSGANATQASLSSITFKVSDNSGSNTATGTLVIGTVIFDTLRGTTAVPDSRWTEDSTGFNFAAELPASAFPVQGNYRIEFTFTPASGAAFPLIFEGPALSRLP